MRLNPKLKSKMNKEIYNVTKGYHDLIPLRDIFHVLYKENIVILQEDMTEFQGMLVGRNSQAYFDIAPRDSYDGKFYKPFTNARLNIMWYQMPSNRYEITCYIG
jgi:hypothetical protein